MNPLNTLYARSLSGKIKMWSISIKDANTLLISHGYLDGTIQQMESTVTQKTAKGQMNSKIKSQQRKDTGYLGKFNLTTSSGSPMGPKVSPS